MARQIASSTYPKATLLIVDDDPLSRDFLRYLLESQFEILMAEEGHAALQALQYRSVTLVITDLNMPGMGGEELLRRIKTVQRAPPVVVMSSNFHMGNTSPEALLHAGATAVVSKWELGSVLPQTLKELGF